jgi:hypothetical protein
MRRAKIALFASAFALSFITISARAQDSGFESGSYDVYDRSVIDAQPIMRPVSAIASAQSARRIYETRLLHAGRELSASWISVGGMVSVSYSGGVRHLHRGTYCMR